MPRARLLVLASAITLASGCASWFPEPEEPKEPEPEELGEREMDFGVSYIKPDSAIVFMQPSYQHVVLPSGATVSYRDDWEEDALERVAERIDQETEEPKSAAADEASDVEADEQAMEGDESEASASENVPEQPEKSRRYRAWEKLCDDRTDEITDGEFFLLTTTDIPEELGEECDQDDALSRIRK